MAWQRRQISNKVENLGKADIWKLLNFQWDYITILSSFYSAVRWRKIGYMDLFIERQINRLTELLTLLTRTSPLFICSEILDLYMFNILQLQDYNGNTSRLQCGNVSTRQLLCYSWVYLRKLSMYTMAKKITPWLSNRLHVKRPLIKTNQFISWYF